MFIKSYEGAGFVVGATLTGVCIYFTSSVASLAISLVCALMGGWIVKTIQKIGFISMLISVANHSVNIRCL